MKPRTSIALAAMCAICAVGLGMVALPHAAWAQVKVPPGQEKVPPGQEKKQPQGRFPIDPTCQNLGIFGNPPIYNPYPDGIIPTDLCPEFNRVQREVDVIYFRALADSKALTLPTLEGQPPTLQGTGYPAIITLGKLMNYDRNMSAGRDMACASCHLPYAGFTGPIPSVNLGPVAYPGSMHFRFGKRKPQSYTYSPLFPVLNYNTEQQLFFGGNFWDSRSTGYRLQSPDSEQAQHPPTDSQEEGLPDTACIAYKLSLAEYRPLFELIWGEGSLDIKFPQDTAKICSTPGDIPEISGPPPAVPGGNATPIKLSPSDRTKATDVYDRWGQSISFFESSPNVTAFSSKFDAFLKGNYTLTADEQAGYDLFKGKGNCNSCHLDGRGTTLTSGQTDTSNLADARPAFTCFGSANEGLPRNPVDPFYFQTTPDSFGFTPNPQGFNFVDLGLGLFLRSLSGNNPNADWIQFAPGIDGQMQVSSARNAAMTPPQCPIDPATGESTFQKAFFHNGYIKTLKQLVHFYNTRDTSFAFPVQSGFCPAGTIERVTCWPEPEVPNMVDMTTGALGLTDQEENLIVVFLQTLTDGFTTPLPDADTFTGSCTPPTPLSPPPGPTTAAPPPSVTPPVAF
jgi:cytochrome c peroxidase